MVEAPDAATQIAEHLENLARARFGHGRSDVAAGKEQESPDSAR